MRTIRFLLLLLLSLTVTCTWADILPVPRGGQRPFEPQNPNLPPQPPEKNLLGTPLNGKVPEAPTAGNPPATALEPGVALEAAKVQIRIKKEAAAGTGGKISRLVALVKGEFDLVCSAVPQGKDLDVFFPLAYEDEGPPETLRFAVAIDGKPAAQVKKDNLSVMEENNRPRTLWGYAWRLAGLRGGAKRRIIVQYAIVLPQKEGQAQFVYFLRSGSRWDGPIGKEVINITADPGLRLKVLSPVALQPEQRSDTSLTWKITNAKPAEDLRLIIVPGPQP
ncbi:MAG: hypothetical protein WBQ36_16305 [Desulfobaccales bacterium]